MNNKIESFYFNKKHYPAFPDQDKTLLYILEKIRRKDIIGVEIGCWTGRLTSIFASFIKELNGILYCVDWFKGSEYTNLKEISQRENIKQQFLNNMKTLELLENIKLLEMISIEASKYIEDNSVDFVFIDADHRYQYIKDDIEHWYPKIKKGGLIFGHDCEEYYINLSDEIKEKIDKNIDFPWISVGFTKESIEFGHIGIIKFLYEKFKENYIITNGIWWTIK